MIETEKFLRDLAKEIEEKINDTIGKKGFALLVFDFNDPSNLANYISNAERSDMISVLIETAHRLAYHKDIPPAIGKMQ